MLGSPILYLKGMRILMFQLSGFYYIQSYYKCYLTVSEPRQYTKYGGTSRFRTGFRHILRYIYIYIYTYIHIYIYI